MLNAAVGHQFLAPSTSVVQVDGVIDLELLPRFVHSFLKRPPSALFLRFFPADQ